VTVTLKLLFYKKWSSLFSANSPSDCTERTKAVPYTSLACIKSSITRY